MPALGRGASPPPAPIDSRRRASRWTARRGSISRTEASIGGFAPSEVGGTARPTALVGRSGGPAVRRPGGPESLGASQARALLLLRSRRSAFGPRTQEVAVPAGEACLSAAGSIRLEVKGGNVLPRLRSIHKATTQRLEAIQRIGYTQTKDAPSKGWPALLRKFMEHRVLGQDANAYGSGHEILLQGFNWESHWTTWYKTLEEQADWLARVGFTAVWLPPPSDSVSRQGYMPRDLYCLDSEYGSEAELRHLIRHLHGKGLKVVADVVLNHRCAHYQNEEGVWNKFGGKLDWDEHAVVCNDPNFRGKGNARPHGRQFFDAAPNIDHSQDFVRRDLSGWLLWLRKSVGFDGFRFDFVRGFDGSYIKEYVQFSSPVFCVGEFWDSMGYGEHGQMSYNQDSHRQRIINWIHSTGNHSTAFDITTKGILHAVFERCEYWRLKDECGQPPGLMGWWKSRAVTFLENHDTGSTQGHWRFPEHALEQGYAYILTHPGTPTVFYDHFVYNDQVRSAVEKLIKLRRQMAIHCRSTVNILTAEERIYVAEIDAKVLVKIGPGYFEADSHQWRSAAEGSDWKVWWK